MLFSNVEIKIKCLLSFSHNFNNKKYIFIRINLFTSLTSPNTIFSAIEYRYKAQSSEICLKMLSDQKRQKNSGHHRLKF